MTRWKDKNEATKEILGLVKEYYKEFHEPSQNKPFSIGDRISYAGRVYDEKELQACTEAALEFWLTSGRYTDEFEAKLAEYLGVKFCALVNSGLPNSLM